MSYVVFGKPDCPWCDKAVKLLEEHSEEFYYYDLTDPEHSDALDSFKRQGIKTVPQVYEVVSRFGTFAISERLGGYEALEERLKEYDF